MNLEKVSFPAERKADMVRSDNTFGADAELDRITLGQALYDPVSVGNLSATGLAPGWRCLEVSGGGPSISRWLAARVAPAGSVAVIGLAPTFRSELEAAGVTVLADPVEDQRLAESSFDLIHVRFALCRLPEREQVLTKLLAALRPGGWLVCEEPTAPTQRTPVDPDYPGGREFEVLYDRANRALADLGWGDWSAWTRRLPVRLHRAGLIDVTAAVHDPVYRGGSPGARFWQLILQGIVGTMVLRRAATRVEVTAFLARFDDPDFFTTGTAMLAVRAQRPGFTARQPKHQSPERFAATQR